jgi:hypothetical protein
MANEAIPKNPMLVSAPEQEVDTRPRKSEEDDFQFKDPSKMNLKELMESTGDDVASERAIKKDSVGNMAGAQEGSNIEREDSPRYRPMGQAWHKNLYEQWRTSPRTPSGLPSWEELGHQGRGNWMNSPEGKSVLTPAKLKFKETNYVPEVGRAVGPTTSDVRRATSTKGDAIRHKRDELSGLIAQSSTVIDPTKTGPSDSSIAFGDNYEHHQKLSALVDRIAAKHNGSSSAAGDLETKARKSISDSYLAQAAGKPKDAISHFTTAVGHVMGLATAVKGAAHNAGEGSGAGVAPEHLEASDHLNNYLDYVHSIKNLKLR